MSSKARFTSVALFFLAPPSSQASEFEPVIWQVSQSDGSRILLQDLKIDGQGRAWMLWRSGHAVFLSSINDEGLTGPGFQLIEPVEDPRDRRFFLEMAVDSNGQIWCARMEDREAPSHYRPLLPVDLLRFDEQEMELVGTFEFERFIEPLLFAFAGSEPFVLSEYYENHWEVLYLNTGDFWGNLHVFFDDAYVLDTAQVGSSLAIFLVDPYWIGGCGGCYVRSFDLMVLDPVNKESNVFDFGGVIGWEEYLGGEEWHAFLDSYYRFLSLGSDHAGRMFVAYEKDDEPRPFYPIYQPSSADSLNELVVRSVAAASGDSLTEWTFGSSRGSSLASVTENASPPGLITHRESELDLWILEEQRWSGPFPVASPTSASVRIAADDQNRYWLAWDDGAALHATVVSLSDLGLPTAVTEALSPEAKPAAPTLGQNFPNPFNAQTVIQLQSPDSAVLEIFNLRGQLLRSMPVLPGSSQVIWDGTGSEGFQAGSGVYLYRLRIDDHASPLRRMTLLR